MLPSRAVLAAISAVVALAVAAPAAAAVAVPAVVGPAAALPALGARGAGEPAAGFASVSAAAPLAAPAAASFRSVSAAAPLAAPGGATNGATAPGATDTPPPRRPAPAAPVDLNAASEKELAALPGVSRAAAKRIVAGRPYGAVDDLARAGIPAKTIQKIRRLVVAGPPSGAAAAPLRASGTAAGASGAPSRPAIVPDAGAQRSAPPIRGAAGPRVVQSTALTVPPPPPRVDINHASLKELQTLPGVDAETAARIVAARPYADVEALERTGMSAAVIARLAPLASTGPEPSTAPPPRQ